MEKIIKILSNKARFIKEQCDNTIDLRRKKSDEVNELLKTREYDTIDNSFKYLISMPISSLITENIDRLLNEKVDKETEYQILLNMSIEEIWIKELKELANFYKVYIIERKSRSNYKKVKKSKKSLK